MKQESPMKEMAKQKQLKEE